eukprot:GHVL01031359.1.p2 GENE.GHVL01031359.1~~GHVL01031359.1.p2  ORF type:complete len:126 (+),score=13.89 GHVL01031359.1:599-976(+)
MGSLLLQMVFDPSCQTAMDSFLMMINKSDPGPYQQLMITLLTDMLLTHTTRTFEQSKDPMYGIRLSTHDIYVLVDVIIRELQRLPKEFPNGYLLKILEVVRRFEYWSKYRETEINEICVEGALFY